MNQERQYLKLQSRIARLVFLLDDMPDYLHPAIRKLIAENEGQARELEKQMIQEPTTRKVGA